MSVQTSTSRAASQPAYPAVIKTICDLKWSKLSQAELVNVAWAYYYFSVQFRENLEIASGLYPDDERLRELDRGERDTDNLSPWPGVAKAGERMNHDEFMKRALALSEIPAAKRLALEKLGKMYLANTREHDKMTRALSIASYEDGGLEKVFTAMLTATNWDGTLLAAFKHFLSEHVRFDSDPDAGHGALCRHLTPDDRVLPLWTEFHKILVEAAPALAAK